jgi:hypothetical protein
MVFSDDPYRLYTPYHELDRKGVLDRFILVDTTAMHNPFYHRWQRIHHGERWPCGRGQTAAEKGR